VTRIASFAAGFAAGWIVRSAVDSSHEAVVKLVSLGYDAAARARRIFALERERFDDLMAEVGVHVRAERRSEPTTNGVHQREHVA
jgi:hypothetical protein